MGEKISIKFFNKELCSTNNECPYGFQRAYCNDICNCPDLLLRGRIFSLKSTGAKCIILVSTVKAGKKYKIEEYSNDSKEYIFYQKIWESWWARSQSDGQFIIE